MAEKDTSPTRSPDRVDAMRAVEVRFTRPLVLPRRVGLFLAEGDAFYVGDAPSGPAYLTGRFDR